MRPLSLTLLGVVRVVDGKALLVSRDGNGNEFVLVALEMIDQILESAKLNVDVSGEPAFFTLTFPNLAMPDA